MIPSAAEQLREHVRGWPAADIKAAIQAGLPELGEGLVALLAQWLASEVIDAIPPLEQSQVEAIWTAIQRRAQ
jgi:hypothetical protein